MTLFFHIKICFISQNHYQTLQINRNALLGDLKKSYRQLALKWHPDKCNDDCATIMFQKVSNAFEVLSDPERREEYDNAHPDFTYTSDNVNVNDESEPASTNSEEDLDRRIAAENVLVNFYVNCVAEQLSKNSSYLGILAAFSIPAALLLLKSKGFDLSHRESVLAATLAFLAMPEGSLKVMREISKEDRALVIHSILILLENHI